MTTETKTSQSKDKLEDDPRFKFGPELIQTAQDARQAYETGVITKEEFIIAAGRFGEVPTFTEVEDLEKVREALADKADDSKLRATPPEVAEAVKDAVLEDKEQKQKDADKLAKDAEKAGVEPATFKTNPDAEPQSNKPPVAEKK